MILLPYPSFAHTAAVLDSETLDEQRLEIDVLLRCLRRAKRGLPADADTDAINWLGSEGALAVHMTLCEWEWQARGRTHNIILPYMRSGIREGAYGADDALPRDMREAVVPPWLGRQDIHEAHRAELLSKKPDWYGSFGW